MTTTYKQTRFHEDGQRLVYARVDRQTWSFFHQEGSARPRRVGPLYATERELLADADRYGEEWGF
jgi:hypothetical protein